MRRARRLILVLTVGPLLVGALAVFSPAEAKRGTCPNETAACDPRCRHWCPYYKKIGDWDCSFVGCLETTGECTYGNCYPR